LIKKYGADWFREAPAIDQIEASASYLNLQIFIFGGRIVKYPVKENLVSRDFDASSWAT
jgi:hypothetical protein